MDFTKYLIDSPPPSSTDYLLIAFAKVGKELRQFPVASFYERFVADTELAADPDFNPFELLRSGMSCAEIEAALNKHGFLIIVGTCEVGLSKAREVYQREVDIKFAEFRRDMCVDLNITDLPSDFIEQAISDAHARYGIKKYRMDQLDLEDIHRAVRKQLVINQSLIDKLRA